MRLFITILLFNLVFCYALHGQQASVSLSEEHLTKVEKLQSPLKKLAAYRKYYSKDSVKQYKLAERYIKRKADSLSAIAKTHQQHHSNTHNQLSNRIKNTINSELHTAKLRNKLFSSENYRFPVEAEMRFTEQTLQTLYALSQDKSVIHQLGTNQLQNIDIVRASEYSYHFDVKDQLASNLPTGNLTQKSNDVSSGLFRRLQSTKLSRQHGKAAKQARELKAYQQQYGKVFQSKDSLKRLAGEEAAHLLASRQKEFKELNQLPAQLKTTRAANPWKNEYKDQVDNLSDTTNMKQKGKELATESAINYLADNPQLLKGLQRKMNLLMKRYSVVPNSNDLSSAVNRSSLSGKPLRQRMYFSANFQIITLKPISIDISPLIGYKFNKRFIVGVGGTYRNTFAKNKSLLSPNVIGYKSFVSYELINSIFAYSEYAHNSPGIETTELGRVRIWKQALLLGIGRKFAIHKKLEMTCLAAYNFLHSPKDVIYPKPFFFRIGFQFSELAFLNRN